METIYSRIIWRELGNNFENFKIHEQPVEVVEKMIIDWIKTAPIEKVKTTIAELSWIKKVKSDGHYDGDFYKIIQNDNDNEFLMHDTTLLPAILNIAIETKMSPSELRFVADILETLQERTK